MIHLASTGDTFASVGGILTGLAEILALTGAGIGFLVRSRRNTRRERLRTETAAGLAAQEAKKQLEAKLDRQHQEQIELYRQQIESLVARQEAEKDDLARSYESTIEQYKQQVADLRRDRESLLRRLLGKPGKEPESDD